MATFKDSEGGKRQFEFDAFNLDRIRSEHSIDLADLSGSGFAKIDNDIDLVKVLAVIFVEDLKDMARVIRGKVIDKARAAVMEAAADFFPPRRWSEIQSNLAKRRAMEIPMAVMPERINEALPLMQAFMSLTPEERASLIQEEIGGEGNIDSQALQELASVGGLGATPLKHATNELASVESQPAA